MPDEPAIEQQLAWSEIVHTKLYGKCWHKWVSDWVANAKYTYVCQKCGQDGFRRPEQADPPPYKNYCRDWNHAMPVHLAMTKHGLRERYLEQLGLIGENEQSFFDEPHHIVQAAAEVLQEETSDAT